ncbi:MAG: 2-methylthioadenine synthetase [Thermoprotei archaeon]|nr:MAG: 2-methylthioadenine synthetase [Thermoprotei archaeon]
MARVYIETYGCALNKGDTAIMKTVLLKRGHSIVDDINEADVIIINTCTVRYDTEQKMIKRILELRRLAHEGKKLIIAGCMAKAQPYLVSKLAPEASLVSPQNTENIWIPVESKDKVILLSGERKRNILGLVLEDKIAVIPIQEGCLGNCSFCIVKNARRQLVSYPMEKIIDHAKKLIERGAIEIELSGQDTATYGIDLYGKQKLPELVAKITDIKGMFMIRIGMMNPDTMRNILDEIIEALKNPKVYKFLHIPIQSGSDKVLKIMRRRYTVDEFREIVKELRRKIIGITIATDIIVGHPGEEDEDFEATLNILRELEFDRIHIAQYSIRPNTLSASLPQVPSHIKKKRMHVILKTMEDICLKKHREYVGSTSYVIVTEKGCPRPVGRLFNYIPVVLENANEDLVSKVIKAKIRDATFYDLRGLVIT